MIETVRKRFLTAAEDSSLRRSGEAVKGGRRNCTRRIVHRERSRTVHTDDVGWNDHGNH
jgi:hypothetical protein